jgi:hypothetical protein
MEELQSELTRLTEAGKPLTLLIRVESSSRSADLVHALEIAERAGVRVSVINIP